MSKLTATLEDIGVTMGVHKQLPETNLYPQPERRAGPMRFAYPSGSRPLEGFTIKRGIGMGGFGEVYFATSDAGKEVALKHIQRHLDIELRGVTQCLNLKHVNLLALYDIKYDSADEAWVVMEYISGESLKDVIERNPDGMPLSEVHHWFDGVASGVKYLHEHGIVHRDLKPGNIFADEEVVKIGDYGLSKFISCSRRSGQTESVGTFHYMAPEIGRGVYGKEIDIYALGIILHEMLTGQVPFDGESTQEIIMRHLTADPDLSRVPAPYVGVIRKSLAKDPAHRYASVAEMREDLERARTGNVSSAPRFGIPGRAPLAVPPFLHVGPKAIPAQSPRPGSPEMVYIDKDGINPLGASDEGIFLGPLREIPSANVHSSTTASADEPIARAVRSGLARARAGFHKSFENAPVAKVVVICLLAIAIIANAGFLIPLGILSLALYLIYYGIRSLTLSTGQTRQPVRHVVVRRSAEAAAREACRLKPWNQRLMELVGSMLTATIVCGVLGALILLLVDGPVFGTLEFWACYLWLVLTGLLGSWLLLVTGKVWESAEQPDNRHRRLVLLVSGLALGLAAYLLAGFLEVDLRPLAEGPRGLKRPEPHGWYSVAGMPELPAYLFYFAGLLAVPRWWRSVDPLRRARLGLVTVVGLTAWAWILHLILYFPQPAGLAVTVMMAIASQLSAPRWDRQKLNEPCYRGRGVV